MKINFKDKTYKVPATPEYYGKGGYKPGARERFMDALGLGKAYKKSLLKRDEQMNQSNWFKRSSK